MPRPRPIESRYLTLVDSLRAQAVRRPNAPIYHFLESGEVDGPISTLTFGALDERARTVAAALLAAGGQGERVLLAFVPGLDFACAFVGCLYAGAVAVPIYLPEPSRIERRLPQLQAIVESARPMLGLTTRALHALMEPLGQTLPAWAGLQWLAVDELDPGLGGSWQRPSLGRLGPEALAFLQYTSGSTALPRGVMVRHGNLVHNAHAIAELFGITEESRGFLWLPPYHDMGLIGGLVAPIYTGGTGYLMSPLAFLERPLRWLRGISHFRATISGGPNFAYQLCARRARPEDVAALDLSSWALAFNGAERVRPETLEQFSATFGPAGFRRGAFYPCYGLAESTLLVTGPRRGELPRVCDVRREDLAAGRVRWTDPEAPEGQPSISPLRLVGCGRPPAGHELVVVDPVTRRCVDEGQVGELWIAGPSVAQGYFGRPEETRACFEGTLADTGEGPFLRTGDLGFVHGGQVFVTGRLKDLIIIRGRNIYPEDIEQAVESCHPALRPGCGAAFAVEAPDGERLVVVHEVTARPAGRDGRDGRDEGGEAAVVEAATAAIRRVAAEQFGIEAEGVLVAARTIPKTSSGKIQRHACRQDYLAGTLVRVGGSPAPSSVTADAIAERLAAWLARRQGIKPPASIDIEQPLAAHGLDSLALAELADELGRWTKRTVPLAWLWNTKSLGDLAARLVSSPSPGTLSPEAAASTRPAAPPEVAATGRARSSSRARAPLCECQPTVLRLASAVPERVFAQETVYEEVFRPWYRELPDAARLFRNSGVAWRRCFYGPDQIRGFAALPTGDRMALWKEGALTLGRRSMGAALAGPGLGPGPGPDIDPQEIGSLVMVSCTGYDTPSPDLLLAGEFGLRPTLRRTFIGHMGCFAAFRGIQVALDALAARPDEAVLVTCTELCSIHVRSEATAEQAVCHALFGDASASLVLGQAPAGAGPQILTTRSEILYAEAKHMGWTVTNAGFRMFLSPEVPAILGREVGGFVARLLAPLRLGRSDIRHWGIHPGGPKIVEVVAEALEIGDRGRRPALTTLREYGNCSSPTVLLVLEHILQKEAPRRGEHGVLLAFGPGLTMEGLVLRF